ncbi:MAG: hypothetical protein WCG08_13095 [Paludibacter sp.]
MTHGDFISLVKQPKTVKSELVTDLKVMLENYPYFVAPRLMLAFALNQSKDINSSAFLTESAVYCADREWFYNYIYTEKVLSEQPVRHERISKNSGNYFDMINAIESEGGDSKQSLKNLAQKLKEAREMVVRTEKPKISKSIDPEKTKDIVINDEIPVKVDLMPIENEISENIAKKLIAERKYADAIEILRALNLNNPKKSVYFADQIRFLEKVIVNSKK